MSAIILNPVLQEEKTGCGIACCAVLAGVTYEDAKKRASDLGICAENPSLWSDTQHVRTLLRAYKIDSEPREIPFVSWDELPDLALLAIKWKIENETAFWHWVVFCRWGDASFVIDSKKSLKNHVRKDFGRMKPKWYIPVKHIG